MDPTPTVEEFWRACRAALPDLPDAPDAAPEAWAFGATPAHADSLLALVLAGTKTATASSLWDYQHSGEPVPEAGWLNIILDGRGVPRALMETVAVEVVPFDEVSESHACAEGEGDRSLAYWRAAHERYWREHSENPKGFAPDMPILCERLQLLFS